MKFRFSRRVFPPLGLVLLISGLIASVVAVLRSTELRRMAAGGEWTVHTISTDSGGPDGAEIADFNHDGKSDVVVPYEGIDKVKLFLSPNDPKQDSWPGFVISQVPDPEEVEVGDVNGDGFPDVLVGTEEGGGAINLLVAPSNPQQIPWQKVEITASKFGRDGYNVMKLVDMDGQYGPDIVATLKDNNGALVWFKAPPNPLQGNQWTRYIIDESSLMKGGYSPLIIDLDSDGDKDIFAGGRDSGQLAWFENSGNPTAGWMKHFIGGGDGFFWTALGDVNTDGRVDIVVAHSSSHKVVWYEQPADLKTASSWIKHQIADSQVFGDSVTTGVAVADINGNAYLDIIVGENGRGRIHWFEQTAPDTWIHTLIYPNNGGKIDEISPFDFDDDGDLDILAQDQVSSPNRVFWLENPFGGGTPSATPTPPHLIGDINIDGKVDIFDYNLLLEQFGQHDYPPADLDNDGDVDIFDYNLLLENLGEEQ